MPIWVDGVEGGCIAGDDPGFTRGLNAFDTARTYGRAPFRLARHLARLEASAATMGIPWPGRALLEAEIAAAIDEDVILRVTLTAGGRRVLDVKPIDPAYVGAPITLARVGWPAMPGLPGTVKHGSRAGWALTARALGATEILLVRDGRVLEANRSNVFAVVDGVIVTPPLTGEQLSGVTRGGMVEAGRRAGLPLEEAPLSADADFQELYVSSTLKELSPVSHLDGRPVGGGPLGAKLHAAFKALVAEECGRQVEQGAGEAPR